MLTKKSKNKKTSKSKEKISLKRKSNSKLKLKKNIKKQSIKKRKSKKVKENQEKNLLYLLLAVLIVSLVIFFYLGNNQPELTKIQSNLANNQILSNVNLEPNIEIILDENNSRWVYNSLNSYADCVVSYVNDEIDFKKRIGIIKPNSKKEIFEINDNYSLKIICQKRDNINISICEYSTFELYDAALKNNKLLQCMDYYNDIPYQYYCAALISKNLKYCEMIYDKPRRVQCLAFNQKNSELCNELNGFDRDWCFKDLATNWNDEQLCEKIINENFKGSCLAVIKNEVNFCMNLNDEFIESCIIQLGESSHDKSYCENLVNSENCYEKLAWLN
jgi:hypothetical protein